MPPVIRLVRLPGNQVIRTLVDNAPLAAGWRASGGARWSGSRCPTEDGAKMPGMLLKPADFDSTRKYPLLFFVYGGPGNTEVKDAWGGYYLWHTMLTQKGYLVAVVDNRGTPGAAGPRLAEGDLRTARRARDRRPGGGRAVPASGPTSIPAGWASGAGAMARS